MSIFDFSNFDVLDAWKAGLIVAYVIATAGVLIGVYWEREEYPKDVQEYGWRVLVKSLAVELFCGSMIFAIDARIGHLQRDEIIALGKKLGDAQTQLVQIELPRMLKSQNEFEAAVRKIKFSGSYEVLYDPASTDAPTLADFIWFSILQGGWNPGPEQPIGAKPLPSRSTEFGDDSLNLPPARAAGGDITGISVVVAKPLPPNPDLSDFSAAQDLVNVLKDAIEGGIPGYVWFRPRLGFSKGKIRIIVGQKLL